MSMSPHERYCRDVEFKVLVDMIESMIRECRYTPTELREAVILASIHHDAKNPGPSILVSKYDYDRFLQVGLKIQPFDPKANEKYFDDLGLSEHPEIQETQDLKD